VVHISPVPQGPEKTPEKHDQYTEDKKNDQPVSEGPSGMS